MVVWVSEEKLATVFPHRPSPGVQLPCETERKDEAERGHSKVEQSCDLLKYRPRRFQASLIAGILKRRSHISEEKNFQHGIA